MNWGVSGLHQTQVGVHIRVATAIPTGDWSFLSQIVVNSCSDDFSGLGTSDLEFSGAFAWSRIRFVPWFLTSIFCCYQNNLIPFIPSFKFLAHTAEQHARFFLKMLCKSHPDPGATHSSQRATLTRTFIAASQHTKKGT